jgi:hypothetical protein
VTEWLSTHRKARVALLVGAGATIGSLLLAFVLVGIDRAAGDDQADAGPNTPVAPTAVDESRPRNSQDLWIGVSRGSLITS